MAGSLMAICGIQVCSCQDRDTSRARCTSGPRPDVDRGNPPGRIRDIPDEVAGTVRDDGSMAETPAAPETEPSGGPTPHRPLRRSRDGRVLAGVCAGLGRHTDIDPIVYRVAFALLTVANGMGVLLYLLGWLIIPDEYAERSRAERILRRRINPSAGLVLFVVILALGLVASGLSNGLGGATMVLLAVLVVVLLVAHARGVDVIAALRSLPGQVQRQRAAPPPAPPHASPPPPPGSAPPAPPGPSPGPTPPGPFPPQPAPQGPYAAQPYAPRPPGPKPPPPGPPATARRRGPSPLTLLTLAIATSVAGVLALLGAAGVMNAPAELVLAAVLVTIGLGLALGTWYGRSPVLVLAGLAVSAALVATTVDVNMDNPLRGGVGDVTWRPASAQEVAQPFRFGCCDAVLDLTALPPSKSEYDVQARLSFGELRVVIPPDATVDVDAYVGAGSVRLPGRTEDGAPVRSGYVIPPASKTSDTSPRINLALRVDGGELEVRRAPT
ncbi:MAG: PspC domain-containing protein [Streptosporangiales bacterium]|nr:PspC domain-containing protein [Streptosporangiales bacterium]